MVISPDAPTNFMHSMIVAQPFTYLVKLSELGEMEKTPIIAWAPCAENPYRAMMPMTLSGFRRMAPGMAILMPCGMVHSLDFAVCFGSAEEWIARRFVTAGTAAAEDVRSRYTVGEGTHKAPSEARATPDEPAETHAEGYNVEWQKEPFKTNSFWHYDDPNYEFVFQVEGGTGMPPKPTATVVKIKRDEFMAMKKDKTVLDYADVVSGPADADEEEEEDLI
jgi:hypothetical protein